LATDVEAFLKRFDRAKKNREKIAPVVDEAYEFAVPLRESVYSDGSTYRARTERLFDSTAPGAVQDLGSEMVDDIWPADSKPFELIAGRDVPAAEHEMVNKALEEVTEEIILTVNNSNFRAVAGEAMCDWAIGTGFILPETGDAVEPLRNRCIPLSEALPDTGPHDTIDALFRQVEVRAGDVAARWPNATLTQQIEDKAKSSPDEMLKFAEGQWRDWSVKGTETWRYGCVHIAEKLAIDEGEYSGSGSKPFVDFSYMRLPRHAVGRGPVQIALPDIKSLNLAVEMLLEAGDLGIGGLFTAEDDGVMNLDNITLESRTIVPYAKGSAGLKRVDTAVDVRFADYLVKDLRESVRHILLGDDLGPVQGTPPSATEVLERKARRARRRAGPYSRLVVELLFQYVRRVAYVLREQGRIKLPAIDGRLVVFRPLSPITRAQAQDEILRYARYLEMGNSLFGPQQVSLYEDAQQGLGFLREKWGAPASTVRPAVERKQLAAAIAAMQALGQQKQISAPSA
jgi:hypothetical protein